MFSSTTTALSTSMPTANASPARLITFSERPSRFSIRNVPMMLVGIASAMTSVERPLRRNSSKHEDRQHAADEDVLLHQADRPSRCSRSRRRPGSAPALAGEHVFVQLLGGVARSPSMTSSTLAPVSRAALMAMLDEPKRRTRPSGFL